MTTFDYYVADAFTSSRFQGNPAGVLPVADNLTEDQMQAVAAEINLSETSFVLRPTVPDADIRIRWFTPQVEVQMCGHATLGAAHILRQTGRWSDASKPIRIETASGVLTVEIDLSGARPMYWLRMPTPRLTRAMLDPMAFADACRVNFKDFVPQLPLMITQDRDLIIPVKNHEVLLAAQPDMARLADLCVRNHLRGVCLTTRQPVSAAMTLQSRFFAPAIGIPEDPVTGSVHGPLGAYLVLHNLIPLAEGEAIAHCLQTPANGRVGLLRVWVQQDMDGPIKTVRVGGEVVATMRGEIYLD